VAISPADQLDLKVFFLVLQPLLQKMKTKKLISKYLAGLWLFSVLGFLVLQSGTELSKSRNSQQKNQDTQEQILVATHQSQASDISPDLKLLPAFLLPESFDYRINTRIGIPSVFEFHSLLKAVLIQILTSGISINAP
jgi:hypothetical protein